MLDRLAAVTGNPAGALEHALPELRDPPPDWRQVRHLAQLACPRCTARHDGGLVRRLFAQHEFLCARHGYWIGPPDYTLDHRPQRLDRLIPELTTAQHRHNRLVRQHGWLKAFNAIDCSLSICIDLRFHGQQHQREPWGDRIDQLIPSSALFTGSLFLAAFYPEIVHLAELFCSPAWRPIAEQALASPEHRAAITAQIDRVLDRHPNPSHYDHNYVVTTWLQGMISASHFEPDKTFPETRHNTIDGTAARPDALLLKRRRKARQEFRKHRHAPAWTLPRNIRQTSPTFPPPSQAVPR